MIPKSLTAAIRTYSRTRARDRAADERRTRKEAERREAEHRESAAIAAVDADIIFEWVDGDDGRDLREHARHADSGPVPLTAWIDRDGRRTHQPYAGCERITMTYDSALHIHHVVGAASEYRIARQPSELTRAAHAAALASLARDIAEGHILANVEGELRRAT